MYWNKWGVYILSYSEKKEVLETILSQANGRVPIYAGVCCISTKETINQSLIAKFIGADVLSIIVPWFAADSKEELYSHYKEISKKIDLPIVLYNIPSIITNKIEVNALKKTLQNR